MAALKKKHVFDGIYLEALPKKIAKPSIAPEPTEDADEIKQQAQPTINALNQNAEDEFELEDIGGPFEAIDQFEQTDLPTFNYKSLALYINFAYNNIGEDGKKQPLLIYGDPGIGKSEVVTGTAARIAESRGRQFVNWNKASNALKLELIKNPSKYFALIDVRVNKLEPTDFVGIPDIASKVDYLETKQLKWLYFMSQPDADGILFLDEINQGSPQTLRSLFEVVNDRSAGGTSFSPNFSIIGAGNLGSEFEEPIPPQLTNRFLAGVLIADPEGWLEWAEQSGIDKRIIAFVKSNPGENFYVKPKNPDDPFPTPRQITKLSNQLKKLYAYYGQQARQGKEVGTSIYKAVGDIASGLCGVYWARKFLTFLKHIRAFDFKQIVKDTSKLSKESKDKLHALVVYVVGKLRFATSSMIKSGQQVNPNDVEILEGVAKISNALSKEWTLILWNMIKRELPQPNFETALKFYVKGEYDPATKQQFVQKTLPEMKKLLNPQS